MSGSRTRRAARLLVTLSLLATAPAAAAQEPEREGERTGREGEPRVVELRPRVVDLTHRQAAVDGSEERADTPDRTTITLSTDVLFDVDQYHLNAEARRLVDDVADELTELGGRRTVTIEGHTDDQGATDYNQRLSERRAEAVRARLSVQLEDDVTLEAAGYGESRPVAPNARADGTPDDDGRARNRRVVISFPTG